MEKMNGPFIFRGKHMQAVNALGQRLAFNAHGIGELNRRIFICAGAPDLAVRHKAAPDFSAFHQRAMVIDGDIRDADTLDDLCMLAVARQIKYSGLRMAQSCGKNNCDEHGVSAKFLRMVVPPGE